MKILWFANTPCSAIDKLGCSASGGGWLIALESSLKNVTDIELHIAFYHGKNVEPFCLDGVCYHPVYRFGRGSKTQRYLTKLTGYGTDDKKYIPQLLSVIDRVQPDVIHVHGTEENFAMIQPLTTVPVIISMQGLLKPYALKYYSGIPCSIAERHEGLMPKLRFRSASYLFGKLLRDAKREQSMLSGARYVLGRTDWDRRVSRVLAPSSSYFVSNEMLREIFYSTVWQKRMPGGIVQIVTVSSDNLYKGFETIVATAQILALHSAFKFEWTVVGLDERSTSVRTVKSWNRGTWPNLAIKLSGVKTAQEIAGLLLASDIYCQVSHIENSPNSLCEAMLVGMPVIASVAGGTASLLTDSEEGILIQDGEPYSLAGAIAELVANRDLGARFGLQARKRALKRHNVETITTNLVAIYNHVWKSHRKQDNL